MLSFLFVFNFDGQHQRLAQGLWSNAMVFKMKGYPLYTRNDHEIWEWDALDHE